MSVRIESKPVRITVTVLSILLALMFLAAGIPKLLGTPDVIAGFVKYGYPSWFPLLVGTTEVVAAALLLVPRLAWIGASAIVVIMIGATYTHAILGSGEGASAAVTMCLFAIAAFIAYVRWPHRHATVAGVGGGPASVR
jgi:putative oxidoreductase